MNHTLLQTSPVVTPSGVTVRDFRDSHDYDAMSQVFIASHTADGLEESRSGQALEAVYARTPNFDPLSGILLVEHGDQLVAFSTARWEEQPDNQFAHIFNLRVLPEWRTPALTAELLERTERMMSEQAQAHPATSKCWSETFVADTQHWLRDVLEDHGYTPMRAFYTMLRSLAGELPRAALPPGVVTRPALPADYHAIWGAHVASFAEHWGEPVRGEDDYARWLQMSYVDPSLWQIAWAGDEVVGMVLNYVNEAENARFGHNRAYTEDIGVRKAWRGRGIAQALIASSMQMFRERGFAEVALLVDSENTSGALRLYEHLGYQTARTLTSYQKPFNV